MARSPDGPIPPLFLNQRSSMSISGAFDLALRVIRVFQAISLTFSVRYHI